MLLFKILATFLFLCLLVGSAISESRAAGYVQVSYPPSHQHGVTFPPITVKVFYLGGPHNESPRRYTQSNTIGTLTKAVFDYELTHLNTAMEAVDVWIYREGSSGPMCRFVLKGPVSLIVRMKYKGHGNIDKYDCTIELR